MTALPNEEVIKALTNQKEDRVPVAFWHHYTQNEFINGLKFPEQFKKSVQGCKKYIKEVDPDFIKIMTDGFFCYPMKGVNKNDPLDTLKYLKRLSINDPWIEQQVELVKTEKLFTGNKFVFYNIFSPITILKWFLIGYDNSLLKVADKLFTDLYLANPRIVVNALKKISSDLKTLITRIFSEKVTGLYYSTQFIQDERINNKFFFNDVFENIDIDLASFINQYSKINILHICGFDGAKNNLDWFENYPFEIINWSTKTEKVSIKEGRNIFKNKAILGGFGISKQDVLFSGSVSEIEDEVKRIVKEVGKEGLILGADCTVQRETPEENIKLVAEIAHSL